MPERIVVPLDKSPLSMRALEYALKNYATADIHVIHVVDPPDPEFPPWEEPHLPEGSRERWERWTDELFDEAQEMADDYGVELSSSMRVGNPARQIVQYAEEHNANGIIMGSHGRTGVSRVLMGSVAERVMRQSPVTVTVVRSE